MNKKIVVIGAGPTGLGACLRLQQMGHKNWVLIEQNDFTGGLATSFVDSKGFTWDIGGHVIFSHYKYFNDAIDQGVLEYCKKNKQKVLDEQDKKDLKLEKLWCVHKRESWISIDGQDGLIPYPFQNNFFYSKNKQLVKECFDGLYEINNNKVWNKINNYHDLIMKKFGPGIANHFMLPYNLKVWGYPAVEMNSNWIGERVSMVNIKNVLNDYMSKEDKEVNTANKNWGPNSIFRYPKYGGNGSIWRGVGSMLEEQNLLLNTHVLEIDIDKKEIKLSNSNSIKYDYIISTIPIDILLTKVIKKTKNLDVDDLFTRHEKPKFSKTNIIGLGFESEIPDVLKNKSWMYFSSLTKSPFYRITVLSNYSPYMVEKPGKQWSLLCETCETKYRPRPDDLVESTIEGLLNENLIKQKYLDGLISKYEYSTEYGYPTPYLHRDLLLNEIEPVLRQKFSIYSRGRFGGWKYEVSNQDHSLMQGVESVDNILYGCEEQTFFDPDYVNNRKETTRTLY